MKCFVIKYNTTAASLYTFSLDSNSYRDGVVTTHTILLKG